MSLRKLFVRLSVLLSVAIPGASLSGCAVLGIYSVDRIQHGMTEEQVRSVMGGPDETRTEKTTLGPETEWIYYTNGETCSVIFNFERVLKPPRCQDRRKREWMVQSLQARMKTSTALEEQARQLAEWKEKREANEADRARRGLKPSRREPAADSPRDAAPENLKHAVSERFPMEKEMTLADRAQLARRR
jgi:hypothetical protein